MTRVYHHHAEGRFAIFADYNPALVSFFRSLPAARWNAKDKSWTCDATPATAREILRAFPQDSLPEVESVLRKWVSLHATTPPPELRNDITPWPHQDAGRRVCANRHASLLEMGMGTGKSLTALMLMQEWNCRLVLILCPKSVLAVWRREIDNYEPRSHEAVILDRGTCEAKGRQVRGVLANTQRPTYIVVNYESAWRKELAKELLAVEWDCVICDESHRIKSHSGAASKFAWQVGRRAAKRLALTGTFLPHSPLDAFAQYRFLDSGIFGTSWVAFRSKYAQTHPQFPSQVVKYLRQDELAERIDLLAYRVKASDVLQLPPAIHATLPVTLGSVGRKAYDTLEEELIAEVEEGTVTVPNAMVKLLRLSQITSGYVPLDDERPEDDRPTQFAELGTEKMDCLADFLEDIPTTEPVVVFCTFTHDLVRLRELAAKLGRRYGEISGRTKDALTDRATLADNVDLVGVQWQSGGVGIDLTRACYCVFFSHTFNLGNYDQAIARLHRPGQTRPVRYYRLEATGTVDKQIYAALDARREVVEYVLEQLGRTENVTV